MIWLGWCCVTPASGCHGTSHQNFFIGRNQSFCWTISNHFNLYDCRFFGCKAASWYSGSSMGPRLEDRTGILIIFYFTPQVWWSNNIPIVNLKMSLIEFHKVKRFPEILNRRPTFWIKVRMWPSLLSCLHFASISTSNPSCWALMFGLEVSIFSF